MRDIFEKAGFGDEFVTRSDERAILYKKHYESGRLIGVLFVTPTRMVGVMPNGLVWPGKENGNDIVKKK